MCSLVKQKGVLGSTGIVVWSGFRLRMRLAPKSLTPQHKRCAPAAAVAAKQWSRNAWSVQEKDHREEPRIGVACPHLAQNRQAPGSMLRQPETACVRSYYKPRLAPTPHKPTRTTRCQHQARDVRCSRTPRMAMMNSVCMQNGSESQRLAALLLAAAMLLLQQQQVP